MIKRFIKISGTGKFLNYSHNSVPVTNRINEFQKINLLYGENGSGKTTLSIILKSLKDNNGLLAKKRAFDKTFPQTIEILTDITPNPKFTFSNNAWDNHYPNLEIFDVHFINNNIYTGLEIQSSHKKNLFEIIFGSQGIQLKEDIQNIKDSIQGGRTAIRDTTDKIESAIGNTYTATNYCNIQVDNDIDTKITSKESELETAKSFQKIRAKPSLSTISLLVLPFDFSRANDTISQSIDNISELYLRKFNEHKNHLVMDGKEEEWIKQGYDSILANTCPFCTRPFDETTEAIVEAYNQYFNEEYNILLHSISELNSAVSTFNIEAQLIQLETEIISNQNLIEFYKAHVPAQPILSSIIVEMENIKLKFEAIKSLVQTKSLNPIQAMDTAPLTSFKSIITALNKKLSGFNVEIESYNRKILALKSSEQPDVTQHELDLKRLNAIKQRGDTEIKKLCTKLSDYIQALDADTNQKNQKQTQLDTYSANIFASYANKINHYLRAFAPYLEIKDFDSGYVGRSNEPIVKYVLHINGNEIKQDDNPIFPSIKYSLSEGDKSALAISFFLTKLELDGSIKDKVVVFDDPVSSFDLNRRSTTISKLIDIGQSAKQLFIFTHNIIFASEFWKSANQISCTTQSSKIEFIGNSSCIVDYNIDTETLSSIIKDSLRIKDYLTNGCYSDQERRSVARCLRPALESYFYLKFFEIVAPNDWLGNFISKVRSATSTNPLFRLQNSLSELSDINDYSKKYHHRFNTNNESEPVTDAELRNYSERTLNLIQVI